LFDQAPRRSDLNPDMTNVFNTFSPTFVSKHSSGGKLRLGAISKMGDRYLRMLLGVTGVTVELRSYELRELRVTVTLYTTPILLGL